MRLSPIRIRCYHGAMKIVLATPIFPPESGGPGTYTCVIAERLSRAHNVVVVTYSDNPTPLPFARVVAIHKSQRVISRLWKYTFALIHELRDADVVYAQNAVASGFPAVIAGMLRRKPVIIKMVGDEAWERAHQSGATSARLETFLAHPDTSLKTRIFMLVQGFTLRHATLVTAPARYLLEVITKTYRLESGKTEVNVNASEVAHIAPTPRVAHKIAVVARLTKWKGIAGVVRALGMTRQTFPDATLAIAGEGPEHAALVTLVHELSLDAHVTFLGNIPRPEVATLLSSAHVFVLNSEYEGMPHVVLESFAAGTPVIVTNISGTDEVVIHEKNGILVPPGDDTALCTAMLRLFSDDRLRETLVAGGAESLTSQFSLDRHMARLEMFFNRVTKGK